MKKTVQENKGVSAQAPGLATSARERHAHGRLRRWHLYWLTTLRGTGDGTPAHWSPTVQYLHGRDLSGTVDGAGGIGGLLGRSHGYSSGSWAYHNFYHSDGNGNVTALVNTGGTLQASYIYDPYGRYLSGTGTLLTSNVMRFSSKPWVSFLSSSATSGLYYYGYRFYDPYLQRWIERDPIGELGGVNLYSFVANTPFAVFDPMGLLIDAPSKPEWGPDEDAALTRIVHDCWCDGEASTTDCTFVCDAFFQGGFIVGSSAVLICIDNCTACGKTWLASAVGWAKKAKEPPKKPTTTSKPKKETTKLDKP